MSILPETHGISSELLFPSASNESLFGIFTNPCMVFSQSILFSDYVFVSTASLDRRRLISALGM